MIVVALAMIVGMVAAMTVIAVAVAMGRIGAVRGAHARALEKNIDKKKKPRAPRGNSARGFMP
jgi:hypothetical protein